MRRLTVFWMIACLPVLLIAADPVWMKPPSSWTEQDAQQILANSPWSKIVLAGVARLEGESERREGGSMGRPTGVGYDGLEDTKARPYLPKSLFGGDSAPAASGRRAIRLLVRWESALPIRVAELKAHETGTATLPDDGHCIAVYGIPGTFFGDPKKLGNPLRNFAALKREGKAQVKPSSVEVFQSEEGAVAVYLFPRATSITAEDGTVDFTAVIGRIQISQAFKLQEMNFEGKLEL